MDQITRNTYARLQYLLKEAIASLRSAGYVLGESQKELYHSYQSEESAPLSALYNQYIQELKVLQQSCEALSQRWSSRISMMP